MSSVIRTKLSSSWKLFPPGINTISILFWRQIISGFVFSFCYWLDRCDQYKAFIYRTDGGGSGEGAKKEPEADASKYDPPPTL